MDVVAHRVGVARHHLANRGLDVGGLVVKLQQGARVDADHAVDDEFQTGQTNAFVRQPGKIEGPVRVAHVHHDLERRLGHLIQRNLVDRKLELSGVNHAGIAFGAGHGDVQAILEQFGGVTGADHRRNAQLPGDDGGVAGSAAAVGDDGRRALHDRLPVGIRHVGDEHITRLDPVHFRQIVQDPDLARADASADRAPGSQHLALARQFETFQRAGAAAALHGFRARLQDEQFAGLAVFAPFDIHGAAVVLLDNHGLACQCLDILGFQAELATLFGGGVDEFRGLADRLVLGVDHLDGLGTDAATHDGRLARLEVRLVGVELVRVDRALDHGFAQPPGGRDKYDVAEAGFRIHGEHDARGADVRADHALDTRR